MDLQTLRTGGLHLLHDTIKAALAGDDAQDETASSRYGIRDDAEWRDLADGVEAELTNRLEYFVPIDWRL